MFTRDPFDIAPAARRPTRAAWLLLALAFGFAALSATLLKRSQGNLRGAREAAAMRQQLERAQARSEAAARDQSQEADTLQRLRAQQELRQSLRMSWSGLFDALEQAARKVDGRVSITSLAPVATKPGGAQLGIVGLASTNDALLDYVQALQDDPRVRDVGVDSQQLAQNAGANVTRFHLSLLWRPQVQAR